MNVPVSAPFRKQAAKAVFSIIFFIIIYFLLVLLAVGFIILCGWAGIMIVGIHPSFLTLMVGLGLAGMGIMVFAFLIKFIFKKHRKDRSHLMEIKQHDQPALYSLILTTAREAGIKAPKKIYLSPEVNACVFYDSSFWSMFVPVRKNLQIGLGLMNSITVQELKAIIAHEYGHFSQKSMKIGSYVYNVNQVIFNMLYENESYHHLVIAFAKVSSYFTFFAKGAYAIVRQIQFILRKVYEFVNIKYLSLSREMEFHADEVAANIAGPEHLISVLRRMSLADESWNRLIEFYNQRISANIKTENVYPQQVYVMKWMAEKAQIPLWNDLPKVDEIHSARYDRSKLVLNDQWASHPSSSDRIKKLEALHMAAPGENNSPAWSLLEHTEKISEEVSEILFRNVTYEKAPRLISLTEFSEAYLKENNVYALPPEYKGYYDNRNPLSAELSTEHSRPEHSAADLTFSQLFTDDLISTLATLDSIHHDVAVLLKIKSGNTRIRTFDYDGTRYKLSDLDELISRLENQELQLQEELESFDNRIYLFFLRRAHLLHLQNQWQIQCQQFLLQQSEYQLDESIYKRILGDTHFINETTAYSQIESNFSTFSSLEKEFKERLRHMVSSNVYTSVADSEEMEKVKTFCSSQLTYFSRPEYNNEALELLNQAVKMYYRLYNLAFFKSKKDLLNFQLQLI